jgi:hypothetical protein
MACPQLLNLCSVPPQSAREGQVGALGYLNAVGIGIWFASGLQFSTANAVTLQSKERAFIGTTKPNTFTKGFTTPSYSACPSE